MISSTKLLFIELSSLDSWSLQVHAYFGSGACVSSYRRNGYDNKVVIISSDYVPLETGEYPFVLCSLEFTRGSDLRTQLMNIFDGKIQGEQEEERGTIKLRNLKPKKDNNTGYKRKMSSTPWWMK